MNEANKKLGKPKPFDVDMAELRQECSGVTGLLREMLPGKVDYADLVCAEPFARGYCFVYEDP
jgi:hypothetical protein